MAEVPDNTPNTLTKETTLQAEDFLDTPPALRLELLRRGAMEFRPTTSGLFPASQLPEHLLETGMQLAWFRDNAHIAIALMDTGNESLAAPAGKAMLNTLHQHRDRIQGIVSGELDRKDRNNRIPERVDGDNLHLPDRYNVSVQNDSVGYALWATTRMMQGRLIQPTEEDKNLMADVVSYLGAIEYWKDPDAGHWEEDVAIHASSIGVVIAGLSTARDVLKREEKPTEEANELIAIGKRALDEMFEIGITRPSVEAESPLPDEADLVLKSFRELNARGRPVDASMLFLVEPLGVLSDEQAEQVVEKIEDRLKGKHGVSRYLGDTYWGPDFDQLFDLGERTTEAEGRQELRDSRAPHIYSSGEEAQWTLFDPLLSVYYGKKYAASGDEVARHRQLEYLNRSLSQLTETEDGRLLMPEAYYLKDGEWVPNEHTPLLWSQANLLRALRVFESTT